LRVFIIASSGYVTATVSRMKSSSNAFAAICAASVESTTSCAPSASAATTTTVAELRRMTEGLIAMAVATAKS